MSTNVPPVHEATKTPSSTDKESLASFSGSKKDSSSAHEAKGEDRHQVFVIALSAQEKLGVKLLPPTDGVIKHGLSIDSVDNPRLVDAVQTGDWIVAIGGKPIDQMTFTAAVNWIRDLPRPLEISFEIDEARRVEMQQQKRSIKKANDLSKQLVTYSVEFDDTPMGLKFEEAPRRFGIDGAVVCELTGQAKSCGKIKVNDILCKVNDTDVLCRPYAEVMTMLQDAGSSHKTLYFVPKDQLPNVQHISSLRTGSFFVRKATSTDAKQNANLDNHHQQ